MAILEGPILSVQNMSGCAGSWPIPLVYLRGRGFTAEPQMSAAKVAMLFGKPLGARRTKPTHCLSGDYFHLLGPYHSNWYHSLIDQFSLVARWERCGLRRRGVKLIMPELWAYRWPDLVRLAGLQNEDIIWLGSDPIEVERLWLPIDVRLRPTGFGIASRPAQSYVNPQDLRGLRALVHQMLDSGRSQPIERRRILIDRSDSTRDARTRCFRDLAVALASDHGFERLVLGNLSPIDQLRAFRESEIVVAEHGAGLSSMIAMREGATIVEIFPTRAAEVGAHGYNVIAAILGFEQYHTLVDAPFQDILAYLQHIVAPIARDA